MTQDCSSMLLPPGSLCASLATAFRDHFLSKLAWPIRRPVQLILISWWLLYSARQ
jgi:hypothetical protein